eukprot:15484539-Alexandrium_andersonii.AAC.1
MGTPPCELANSWAERCAWAAPCSLASSPAGDRTPGDERRVRAVLSSNPFTTRSLPLLTMNAHSPEVPRTLPSVLKLKKLALSGRLPPPRTPTACSSPGRYRPPGPPPTVRRVGGASRGRGFGGAADPPVRSRPRKSGGRKPPPHGQFLNLRTEGQF